MRGGFGLERTVAALLEMELTARCTRRARVERMRCPRKHCNPPSAGRRRSGTLCRVREQNGRRTACRGGEAQPARGDETDRIHQREHDQHAP